MDTQNIKDEKMMKKLKLALLAGKGILLCPPLESEKIYGIPFEGSPGCTYEPSTCDLCNLDVHLGTKQKQAYETGKYIKICCVCFFKHTGKEQAMELIENNMTSFQELEREEREMEQEKVHMVIACIPADKEEQERLGMSPSKGVAYSPTTCDNCNRKMLISEMQEKSMAKAGCQAWCAECIFELKRKKGDNCEFVDLKDFIKPKEKENA